MYSLKKYIYLIFLFHCFYKNIGHKWHAEYWNSWQNNTVLVLHIKVSDSKVFWYNRNLIRHFDSDSKRSACNAGDPCLILGLEDPLEEGMATHSSIHAWRIPWTEETGSLQSIGLQSWTWLKRLSIHKHGLPMIY